ncbi:HEAT repeat domain-containing protein [Halarchaeum salinum]|uniref:HEAT repeat domain-containing protein n=1 Tax=Halarchaeum salinum TaxID=489912 RepID=UPI003CD075E3
MSAEDEEPRPAERERYEALLDRLAEAEDALEAAETEADLDDMEATLEGIEADIEAADFTDPEEFQPDEEELDEDEDVEELLDFEEELTNELQDLQDELEEQRGPYAADVVNEIETATSTVESTRWTETGDEQVADAIGTFVADVASELDADLGGDDVAALDATIQAVEDAALDADEDEGTIAALLDLADDLQSGIDDSQAFADLSSRAKLQYEGFYDVLGKHKDYPPEWSAIKEWTKRDNVEMVALCMEHFGDSEYMQNHCLEAFVRMGNPEAIEVLKEKAQRRNLTAVEALGKTGHPDAVEGVADYIDSDSNPELQKTALRAVGELGATEHTEDVAQWLVAEREDVRSAAARALGLLGDTRAIDPLGDVLADDAESEGVRASAAWALYQIGTARALETAAEQTGTRSFLVQSEAEKAAAALD